MQECKLVRVPIPVGVNLSADQCPKTQEEEEDMYHGPYVSEVGSLMYAMIYTKPEIAHAVKVFEQVYVKIREGASDNSKEGFQVFAWHCQL